MKPFLTELLEKQLLPQPHPLSETVIILPGKRAGAFLKNELKEKNYTGFTPEIWSIEDFIKKITGLKILDNTNSIFRFYQTYKNLTPSKEQENFETFYAWAQTLIHDFNEIDRYLIETKKLFGNLSDIQEMKHIFTRKEKSKSVKNYLKFWNQLYTYYQAFRQAVLENKEAYQGLVYRKASEEIETFIQNSDKHFVFIGFNALNQAEQKIIQTVLAHQKGKIYWDIDQAFLEDSDHGAGLFIKRYRRKWKYYAIQKNTFEFIDNHFEQEKNIHLTGVPKNIGQAKHVGRLLQNFSEEQLSKTAVILGDEGLLMPVLNSLPENVKNVNITMGLSLEKTPPASLFSLLFKIQENQNPQHYYKNVLDVLNHPTVKLILGDTADKIQAVINKNNKVFITEEELFGQAQSKNLQILKLIFTKNQNINAFLLAVIELTNLLRPENKEHYKIEREYLFHFNRLFHKLKNLLDQYNPLKSIKALQHIYKDMLSGESVDYKGSPFDGLQIMGMLESRVLDFENVILVSVNEKILPSGKSNNSFIPFDLKKNYNLPTYKEKDAVYTYHFYHLLQRSKNIHLIYNTNKSGFNSGEKSRYIKQLEVYKPIKTNTIVGSVVKTTPQKLMEIRKTPQIIERLKIMAQKGFSPSALTTYIRNPLDFYKRYVLRIRDKDEVEETVAYNTLGTVVHNVLEEFYKPYTQKRNIKTEDIQQMEDKIHSSVKKEFEKVYKSSHIKEGKNRIIFEVAKRYVFNFLQTEKKRLKKGSLKILHIESQDLQQDLVINELNFPVKLNGIVDRVELFNNQIRIIDYKTGKVERKDLKIQDWNLLIEDYKYSKAFQVLAYSSMLQHTKEYTEVEAGIFSFKNLNAGFMPFIDTVNKSKMVNQDILSKFHEQLKKLILEMFDESLPFKEKEI